MLKNYSNHQQQLKEEGLTDQQINDLIDALTFIAESVLTKKFMLGGLQHDEQ